MKGTITFFIIFIAIHVNAQINTTFMGKQDTKYILLGGGCFWCTEAIFEEIEGVKGVTSGYAGGDVVNPSYREVCTGNTGHAEVVQVEYDPEVVDEKELLNVFFKTHDPTTLNRQGADVGTQYRSVIFYSDEKQKKAAEDVMEELSSTSRFDDPIVTKLEPFMNFYAAEDYHQDYFKKNPEQSYCSVVIRPKVEKFREDFSEKLKDF